MGIICQVIVNILFLLGMLNNWYGLYGTVAMFFISLCCVGFTYPNASALALAPFTRNVGSASALIGFLQIGIAGLVSTGVGLLNSASNTPIIAMLAGSSLMAFFILWLGNARASMKAARIQLPE
jgi:DHA1 family bicyclomycin/chloramphenicol resistance-like MFS transporter